VEALKQVTQWPVPTAAVAVLVRQADGAVVPAGEIGDPDAAFGLASVSKPLAAYAILVGVEEGAVALDGPAGPAGSTVAHLLAHASGLAFSGERTLARPATRRIYSNSGFDVLGRTLETATDIAFPDYLAEAVFGPLGMGSSALLSSPAYGVTSTLRDLTAFAAELLRPVLLTAGTFSAATSVRFPGLAGVLPGFGLRTPNDWGLGLEIRGEKWPHWTGSRNSARTFGHFGRSGTFLWVDPVAGVGCVGLTDRDFGEWAIDAWPRLADAVLAELATPAPTG
jgi:CubicO group peptidase (beta-lactamase class C family)